MPHRSAGNTSYRPANPVTVRGARHQLAAFWKAIGRLASARTADELNALADRYQLGQPALAAELRAAAVMTQAQGA